jgi:polar amino acid transport system substrate-binding protein
MKKNILNKIFGGLLVATMMLSLGACTNKSEVKPKDGDTNKAESKLDKVKKAGKLVIGTSADYPPYEFHKQVNGKDEIVGFDIEIAKQIAKDMGVQLEIKDITFKGLLADLQTDKIDLVIAGMNPTEERAKEVDFSKVYYKAVQAILVRTEDKDKYKSLDDLKGKKVGVQMSTVQEELAKEQITGAEVKSLGKITDLVLELKNKKVDALVIELPVATSYADKNKDLTVSGLKFKEDSQEKGSAVAVKKGSTEFLEAINSTLDKLMKDKTIEKFVTEANEMVE